MGDQWRVSNSFTLNLGIRGDLPRLTDKPTYNPLVFNTFGIDTSNVPNNQLMISPRLGFNWTPSESGKDQVRGGVGVFAGRTPFVWISNNYGNTGIGITNLSASNVPFNPDPNNPPKNFPPGNVRDLGRRDRSQFQVPQGPSQHAGLRPRAPFGIRASVEAMFTKTLEGHLLHQHQQGPLRGHDVLRRADLQEFNHRVQQHDLPFQHHEGRAAEPRRAAGEALPLRSLRQRDVRLHEREVRIRGDLQRGVLELAVPDGERRHLHPAAHALLLRCAESLQPRRVAGLQDGASEPQRRADLLRAVGAALLDPDGR